MTIIIKPFDQKIHQNNVLDDETVGGVKEIIMQNHNVGLFGEDFAEKFIDLDFYIGDEVVDNSGKMQKKKNDKNFLISEFILFLISNGLFFVP